jgi:hypothetical protein
VRFPIPANLAPEEARRAPLGALQCLSPPSR